MLPLVPRRSHETDFLTEVQSTTHIQHIKEMAVV